MIDRSPLATPQEVAAYLRRTPKTLRNWRSLEIGPAWMKVGRGVRYRWSDVERWLEAQTKVAAA